MLLTSKPSIQALLGRFLLQLFALSLRKVAALVDSGITAFAVLGRTIEHLENAINFKPNLLIDDGGIQPFFILNLKNIFQN